MRPSPAWILSACAMLSSAWAQAPATTPAAAPAARFHHVHLNSVDPAAAVDFYTSKFKARKERFAGLAEGVWTGDSWLLFTKVASPPAAGLVSGIWHIGWGAQDMQAVYEKQLASGTRFATPLTDLAPLVGRPFYYAYVDGPDHALIELNTSGNQNFGHVHLFSASPPQAAQWYQKHLGIRVGRIQPETRIYNDLPIGPSASLAADHVNVILYPIDYAKKSRPEDWSGRSDFESTRGRVIDHLGFSVTDLEATLKTLRAAGVTITSEPRSLGNIKFAFIEGPDRVGIELIQDGSPRPGPIAN